MRATTAIASAVPAAAARGARASAAVTALSASAAATASAAARAPATSARAAAAAAAAAASSASRISRHPCGATRSGVAAAAVGMMARGGATRSASSSAAGAPSGVATRVVAGGAGGHGGPDTKEGAAAAAAAERKPLYLDMQATSPMDPRVLDAMMPLMTDQFGNAHSRTHAYGWEAEAAVEDARDEIAALLGADPKGVIFTSGATEANNIAIKGVARFYRAKKKHIVTTQTEHKCVLDSCRQLEQEGFEVTYLPVQQNGLVDLDALREAVRPGETSLVSVMAVNNEIGVVQPIREIGEICRAAKAFFHCDAAQAAGKIPLDVVDMKIDLLSLSGHKIYGPKGVGALYVGRRPRVRLEPQMNGGGQERGIRSGTLPTALCVGLGAACRVAGEEMERDEAHVRKLSDHMLSYIRENIPETFLNGDEKARYPGNLNVSFSCVEGESLLMGLKDIAVSSGSACTSASLEPSYVLRALGVEEELAHTSLRFGIGRFTTEQEVDMVLTKLRSEVERLRDLSILWEMQQSGIDLSTIKWDAQ